MEKATKNRLRFVHHDDVFETFEEAKQYVENIDEGDKYGRPALYAEPMVMKYKNITEDDPTGEKNPNIILAIGSVGDGTTTTTSNKTFFIDFAGHSKQIEKLINDVNELSGKTEELQVLVNNIINACGLNEDGTYKQSEYNVIKDANSISEAIDLLAKYVESHHLSTKETETIKLIISCVDDNQDVKQDVIEGHIKRQETIVNSLRKEYDNQIEVYENGIFYNITMEYSGKDGDPVYLLINGETAFTFPIEVHAINGKYNSTNETITINLNDGSSFDIDLKKLVGEWKFKNINESTTPIYFTVNRISSETDDYGDEVYHSFVSANVRVSDDEKNILEIHGEGTTHASLFVNGSASNIKTINSNVQTELDIINGGVEVEGSIKKAVNDEATRAKDVEHELKINIHTLSAETAQKFHLVDDEFENLNTEFKTFSAKVEHDFDDERKIRSEADELLKQKLSDETDARIDADKKLFEKTDALSGALATEKSYRESSDNALSDRINSINVIYKEGTNSIIFTDDNGVEHKYDLNAGSIVDSMYYEASKESIIIVYTDTSKVQHTVEVPVRGLINEWDVDNNNSTVTLSKVINTSTGVDKLKANVNIANTSTNMLENVGNALYVSNTGITKNANDIATTNIKLDEEVTRAKAAEAQVLTDANAYTDSKVLAEKNRAEAAELANANEIQKLDHKVDDEINRSTLKDEELSNRIDKNTNDIAALTDNLSKEISDRKEADVEIQNKHQADLVDEINRASAAELALSNDLKSEIANRENAIEVLTTALNGETNRAKNEETVLNDKIKVNTNDIAVLNTKILDEIDRAKDAENVLGKAIVAEENRATLVEQDINAKIVSDETRISSNEEAISALNTKVSEDSDRILNLEKDVTELTNDLDKLEDTVEKAIDEVKSNKIVTNNSGSITLQETIDTTGTTIVGFTNVSENADNIIVGGNSVNGAALFASVDIEYNGATNVMTLKKSNGVTKEITLNSGSIINDIYYKDQALVISYTTSRGEESSVSVPVADFFKEMVVDNTDGAVDVTINKNGAGQWVFSTSANVAESPKQALKKVDNTLFVSNSASDYFVTDGRSVQQAIDDLKAADADLATQINNEVNRAKNAENILQIEIDALSGKTTTNANDIADIKNKVNNHETRITVLENKVEENTNNIKQNTDDIDALIPQVNKNTTDIANLKLRVDNHDGDIININNAIDGLDDRFVHITGDTMTGTLNINALLYVLGNATVGTLTSNGNATVNGTITATSAVYSSDKTIKENIEAISDEDINKVKNVDIKSYSFIEDVNHTKRYGVIAQEVEEAGLENLVEVTPMGTKAVDYISYLILKIAQLEKEIAELKNK